MDRPVTDPAVERYLDQVRASLRGMPRPEIDDIVLELRGHIMERSVAGGIEDTLRALGDPRELGRRYRAESATARAECSNSPIVILHSLLLLHRGTFSGWAALTLTALGYAWALALGAAAMEKILSPHDVGLWYQPGTAAFARLRVDGPGPSGAHEMLGWWLVPLGLAAGAALLYATRLFGLWWIRRARARGASPEVPFPIER